MLTQKIEFVNEKIDEFNEHKNFALDLQRKLSLLYDKRNLYATTTYNNAKSENILKCGTHLEFERFKDAKNTTRIYGANFCKNKLCPMCAWRLHIKNAVKFQRVFNELGEHEYYHLTLTIRNVPNITKEFILSLRQKATKFVKKVMKIDDYFLSFELTIGKDGTFHPHYHIIYIKDEGKEFTKKWLQTQWAYICNYGSKYQIVHNAKCNRKTISRELTKYILKFEDISPNLKQLQIIDTALKGVRKYASNGIFLKAQREIEKVLEKEDFDKMCNLEEYASQILFYNWIGQSYELSEVREVERQERPNQSA